jgi:hypothetical protein
MTAAMAAAMAAATAATMAAKAAKATTVKNNCNNEYSDVSPCFCSYSLNPCIPIQCYGCILFLQIMSGSKMLLCGMIGHKVFDCKKLLMICCQKEKLLKACTLSLKSSGD